jgi:hypothetical protein
MGWKAQASHRRRVDESCNSPSQRRGGDAATSESASAAFRTEHISALLTRGACIRTTPCSGQQTGTRRHTGPIRQVLGDSFSCKFFAALCAVPDG